MKNAPTTTVSTATVVLAVCVATALGCGGYKLDVDYIRNCDKDNVVELSKNFTVKMTDDCRLYFNGCVTMKDNVTSAEIDYTVQKDTVKRSGKKDGCSQLESKSHDIEIGLEILGMPQSCPINKGTLCMENKSIDLSKYKLQMNVLAGRLQGKTLMTTNAGKSCAEFSAKLVHKLVKALSTLNLGTVG